MSFRNKVFLGYLLMALVFSGGVLLCLKTLGPIERSFEKLAAENLPVLNLIQNIRTQGTKLHAEMLEMSSLLSLDVTPSSQRALLMEQAEIEQTRKLLLEDMQRYRKLVELYFPEESSYIPLLQTQIDHLIQMSEELQKQTAGQSNSFSLESKPRFEALEQNFLSVTNEIVSYEVREIQMRREHVNDAVAGAGSWIAAIFIFALAVALALAVLMTRLSSTKEPSGRRGRRLNPATRRKTLRD